MDLDAQLPDRLSSNTGNLLDDEQLISLLANTKAKAAEVKEKLSAADETKKSISEKREQFRPVATRLRVLLRERFRIPTPGRAPRQCPSDARATRCARSVRLSTTPKGVCRPSSTR